MSKSKGKSDSKAIPFNERQQGRPNRLEPWPERPVMPRPKPRPSDSNRPKPSDSNPPPKKPPKKD